MSAATTTTATCRLCGEPTVFASGICLHCKRELASPERQAALKVGAETLLNGLCLGRVVWVPGSGTCLEVVWCGCPDGAHGR